MCCIKYKFPQSYKIYVAIFCGASGVLRISWLSQQPNRSFDMWQKYLWVAWYSHLLFKDKYTCFPLFFFFFLSEKCHRDVTPTRHRWVVDLLFPVWLLWFILNLPEKDNYVKKIVTNILRWKLLLALLDEALMLQLAKMQEYLRWLAVLFLCSNIVVLPWEEALLSGMQVFDSLSSSAHPEIFYTPLAYCHLQT